MNTETNTLEQEQHLFTDQDIVLNREASTGQRFLNFLIDYVVFGFIIDFLTNSFYYWFLSLASQELADAFMSDEASGLFLLATVLTSWINVLLYYTFCEKVFNGVTLGKLVTGTKAIRQDGLALTWKDAFMRSLCRLVPFEPFSALGNWPWHDRWTKTMVIKTR